MSEVDPILLFDGVCNLCSNSVQFVLKRNKKGNVRFAPLQSKAAQEILKDFNLPLAYMDSLVLVENGNVYVKSDAALRVTKHLSGIWNACSIFLIIPTRIRNWVYDIMARNRYSWFGKMDVCWLPKPEWENRFLN